MDKTQNLIGMQQMLTTTLQQLRQSPKRKHQAKLEQQMQQQAQKS